MNYSCHVLAIIILLSCSTLITADEVETKDEVHEPEVTSHDNIISDADEGGSEKDALHATEKVNEPQSEGSREEAIADDVPVTATKPSTTHEDSKENLNEPAEPVEAVDLKDEGEVKPDDSDTHTKEESKDIPSTSSEVPVVDDSVKNDGEQSIDDHAESVGTVESEVTKEHKPAELGEPETPEKVEDVIDEQPVTADEIHKDTDTDTEDPLKDGISEGEQGTVHGGEPVESAKPVEPAEDAKPAEPAEPAEHTEQSDEVEPLESVEPVTPVEQDQHAEDAEPVEQVEQDEHTEHVDREQPEGKSQEAQEIMQDVDGDEPSIDSKYPEEPGVDVPGEEVEPEQQETQPMESEQVIDETETVAASEQQQPHEAESENLQDQSEVTEEPLLGNSQDAKVEEEEPEEEEEKVEEKPVDGGEKDNNGGYKAGSMCSYCKYCPLCKLCKKCLSCNKGKGGSHCGGCKYCKYCRLCDYVCLTICKLGGYLDIFTGSIYAVLPNFSGKSEEDVDKDIDGSKDFIKEYL